MELLAIYLYFYISFAATEIIHLSCKDIRTLVDGHNNRRLMLAKGIVMGQPPANEMKPIIWDKELAAKATAWAAQAKDGHNPDKKIASSRFLVGENLYWYKTTDPNKTLNLELPLKNWWNEHRHFKFGSIAHFSIRNMKKVGHYTQMAWSNSTHLGCALNKTKKDKFYTHFVVCNYGPGGNIMRMLPYKNGIPSKKVECVPKSKCSQKYGPDCS